MPHLPTATSAAAGSSAEADAAQLGRQHAFLSSWQQQVCAHSAAILFSWRPYFYATGAGQRHGLSLCKPEKRAGTCRQKAVMRPCNLLRFYEGFSCTAPSRSHYHA